MSVIETLKKAPQIAREIPHRVDHLDTDLFFSRGVQTLVLAEKGQYIEILGANPPEDKKAEDGPNTLQFPDSDTVVHYFGGAIVHIHDLKYKNGVAVPGKLIASYGTMQGEEIKADTFKLPNGIMVVENDRNGTTN